MVNSSQVKKQVLIFSNIILPKIASHLSMTPNYSGGWIIGLVEELLQSGKVDLTVAFPAFGLKSKVSGSISELRYYGFSQSKSDMHEYNSGVENNVNAIIAEVRPDIVHVFGTEYPHSLAIINACESLGILDRVVINIQGLVSIYARHYYAGVPKSIYLRWKQSDFVKRGKYEIEAIRKVKHVIGRTDWDRACATQINPSVQYHFCNETLRDEFYKHNWDIEKIERHSIFLSQAPYPIKGLHYVLEALPHVLTKFPDTRLYIAGSDTTKNETIKDKLKMGSYGHYIRRLIRALKVSEYVTFVGSLDEKKMCERYLKSHVFALPSSIENSPNSVGEAMLLGVPVVASDVGGVKNMLTHSVEGFVYQHDASYMLGHYIMTIFARDETALVFSENSRVHANATHNKEKNLRDILSIYGLICCDAFRK